jgi:LysR family transcriptional regulator, glycine cleavage system transcriptional activator
LLFNAQIPSIQSLLAFEALARLQNCRMAGQELCLTTGAVSKQLQSLEAILGLDLFTRSKQGMTLTSAGRDYLELIQPALAKIVEAGMRVTRQQARTQLLHIQVPPSFADRWLLPRYSSLTQSELNGKVLFSTYPFSQPDLSFPHMYDAYICIGKGEWPSCRVDYICGQELMLVASPRLLARIRPVAGPADLIGFPILEHSELPLVWPHVLAHFDLQPDQVIHMTPFDFYSVLIRSATVGLGLALLPRCFIPGELASGELVPVLDYRQMDRYGYHFVYLKGRRNEELIRQFRNWLIGQRTDD